MLWLAGCAASDPATAPAAAISEAAVPPASAGLKAFFGRLKAGQKQTVVACGTSLTAIGAGAEATKNWFDQKYPGQVKFVNSGLPGLSSDAGVAQIQEKVL